MDRKLDQYRQILTKIFNDYAEILNRRPKPDRDTEQVIDTVRDHYALHTIGWQGDSRVWNTPLYVRIRNGKISVEIDWMEDGIVDRLLAADVPKEDIVLAFHHPNLRELTEFAVA